MKYQNKIQITLVMVALTFAIVSCGSLTRAFGQYEEEITNVYITEDENFLVAIGKRYFYVFNTPKEIIETLKSHYRQHVSAGFVNFRVESTDKVTGIVKLQLETRFDTRSLRGIKMIQDAQKNCYKKDGYRHFLCILKLEGKRFKVENLKVPDKYSKYSKLNTYYKILIIKTAKSSSGAESPIKFESNVIFDTAVFPFLAAGMGVATLFNNLKTTK